MVSRLAHGGRVSQYGVDSPQSKFLRSFLLKIPGSSLCCPPSLCPSSSTTANTLQHQGFLFSKSFQRFNASKLSLFQRFQRFNTSKLSLFQSFQALKLQSLLSLRAFTAFQASRLSIIIFYKHPSASRLSLFQSFHSFPSFRAFSHIILLQQILSGIKAFSFPILPKLSKLQDLEELLALGSSDYFNTSVLLWHFYI
jgi:hypothetical protein